MFGIVGDPIAQVRSPEMITWEFHRRGVDALLVPLHVPAAEFDTVMPALMRMPNFGGFVLTIPFKTRALAFANHLGLQAQVLGSLNLLVRRSDGSWGGDILDGMGCVAAFQSRGIPIEGRKLMIVGLGGAGKLSNIEIRRCSFMNASQNALSFSASVAPICPGSSTPQWLRSTGPR